MNLTPRSRADAPKSGAPLNATVRPQMTTVAYLYLPTPPPEAVPPMLESIQVAGISVSHFGRSDPPRLWEGDVQAMAELLLKQTEQKKYAFMRDSNQGIDLTFELFYD